MIDKSAILVVEEFEGENQMQYDALVVHNPFSTFPIPIEIWGNIPQLMQNDNEMVWTDKVNPLS